MLCCAEEQTQNPRLITWSLQNSDGHDVITTLQNNPLHCKKYVSWNHIVPHIFEGKQFLWDSVYLQECFASISPSPCWNLTSWEASIARCIPDSSNCFSSSIWIRTGESYMDIQYRLRSINHMYCLCISWNMPTMCTIHCTICSLFPDFSIIFLCHL